MSLGSMVANLSLNYADFINGVRQSKNELGDLQTYSVTVTSQTGRTSTANVTAAATAATSMGRSTRSGMGGLLGTVGRTIGTVAKVGITAASAYGKWKLHTVSMQNQLMQQQLLTRMLAAQPPNAAAGSIAWMRQMGTQSKQTRAGMSGVLRTTLLVAGGLGLMGAAAVTGYRMWSASSRKIRTELLEQKVLTEQIRQMRRGGGGGGGGGGLSMGGMAGGMLLGGMYSRAMSTIASVPMTALSLAGQAEQAQISFETMLGSSDKAETMLGALKGYADNSPFDVKGVNDAAQKLLNYNIQAQDVLPTIKLLGDVAAGDMDKFDRLSTAFGQMSATGRLMGQDLLQFINAGFNPLQEISKKTGESMSTLKKRMEDGGISAMEVRDAFVAATGEGGRFHNMTERQGQTLVGRWAQFKDAIGTALRDLGTELQTNLDLTGWLQYFTSVISKAPYVIRNAGTLIKIEAINWNLALFDLIPGAESTMKQIGAVIFSTWEAATASFGVFFQSVTAGIQEIWNFAKALLQGVIAAAKQTGKWVIEGGKTALGQGTGQKLDSPWAAAANAYTKELASQPDAMTPGSDFASTFSKRFKQTFDAAMEGSSTSMSDDLRRQREDLRASLIEDAAKPAADFGGEEGASFNKEAGKGANDSTSTQRAESSAALIGSQEANKIMTSGMVSIQTKQLDELKKILAALQQGKETGDYREYERLIVATL